MYYMIHAIVDNLRPASTFREEMTNITMNKKQKKANITMNKKQNKGISVVLTTLIIVVASVVLGTAVTLFGTSLFQTGAQSQGVAINQAHIWFKSDCDEDGVTTEADLLTVGAVVVRNSGDKLMAIDTIKIRGTIVPNANWYASNTTLPATSTQQAMTYKPADWDDPDGTWCGVTTFPSTVTVDSVAADDVSLAKQTGPVSLDPGKSAIIYFFAAGSYDANGNNDALTATDVGAAVSLTVQAGQLTQVQSVSVSKQT